MPISLPDGVYVVTQHGHPIAVFSDFEKAHKAVLERRDQLAARYGEAGKRWLEGIVITSFPLNELAEATQK